MRVSAETLNRGWVVWVGVYGLLVGEWVVNGCVVLPLFLGSLVIAMCVSAKNMEYSG